MFVIVDDREIVKTGYATSFDREGVASTGLRPDEFEEWVSGANKPDLQAVEAFLIGDCSNRETFPRLIRERCVAPVIALNDSQSLEQTLELFAAGIDDVVRKPVHVPEIIARVERHPAAQVKPARIQGASARCASIFDGRDPEVDGKPLPLPRRERRILEYLVQNQSTARDQDADLQRRSTACSTTSVDEDVVESHISKLRKKLRSPPRLRPDRFQALPRLLPDAQLRRDVQNFGKAASPRAAFCFFGGARGFS